MDNLTGHTIKGYELLERVSVDDIAAVYRAYQSAIGREVAVKIILPGYANRPDFIRRFEAEARLVARLEHLHIVPLYDYWREPGGAYLVMRWLRGGNLRDALREGPFDLEPAALLLDQVASGLATAHANQVVHGYLKPSHILLDREGNAYVADFVIARILTRVDRQMMRRGATGGSCGYFAPEQALGQPLTPQTDIFSLGVTLYEIISGEHPFPESTGVEGLFKHVGEPLPPIETLPSEVREGINAVIRRATAREPGKRYENVLALAAAFREAARLAGEGAAGELLQALTLREQEVLHYIVEGYTNRQIAQALFIELSTVKWHARRIYSKLGVRSRRQAVAQARKMDLLMPDQEKEAEDATPTDGIGVARPRPLNPYKGLRAFETADSRHFFGRAALIRRLLSRLSADGASSNLPSRAKLSSAQPSAPISNLHSPQPEAERGSASGPDRFLAIVGPSGSGKSSLVKAGLIPALWDGAIPGSERWFVLEIVPGARPLDELEVALIRVAADRAGNVREQLERDANGLLRAAELILPGDESELLLVIDQFEELFTLVGDESARKHVMDMLTAAVTDSRSRVRVVITLRADYYDRPLHYPAFAELVRRHVETILPLSAEELEQAIVRPAEQVGVTFEQGLVATIIDDVLFRPGALPLLQYALTELFEGRDDRLLTHQTYEALGGATGALAKRAEELYQEQEECGRRVIRQMFLRLVSTDAGAEEGGPPDAWRRVPRAQLMAVAADIDLMDELIDTFAAYRLLTLDHDPATRSPTVEVAHEALLREWERLRRWIEESREDLLEQRRLQTLVREWSESGRVPGLLLRQTRLDQYAAWAASTDLALTGDERAFLQASLEARQSRRAEEEERCERELETAQRLAKAEVQRAQEQIRANQRLRWLVAGLAVLFLIGAGAALLAWQENRRATQQARLSAARELAAAAVSNLDVDPERSILLALQAADITYAVDQTVLPEVEDALHRAVQASRIAFTVPGEGAVAYTPGGGLLATSSATGADLWDADTGEHLRALSGHSDGVLGLAFSPDGSRLATAGTDMTARVWDTSTGQLRQTLSGPTKELSCVDFGPDGNVLAAGSLDGSVWVWDAQTGKTLRTFSHGGATAGLDFSPDGNLLAVAVDASPGLVTVWNLSSGEPLTLAGHIEGVNDVAFSPDGARLVTASSDGTAKVWDLTAGEGAAARPTVIMFHGAWVFGVDFSPDGSRIATGSQDGEAKVWEAATGKQLLALAGHKSGVGSVAFSPDGSRLATSGEDGTARVWNITAEGCREWLTLAGHTDLVFSVAYSPDGARLASASWDGTAKVWDADTGCRLLTLAGHTDRVSRVTFNSDGTRLATASYDGTARVWDAISGAELHTLRGHDGWVFGLAFTPDGRRLVTSGADGKVRVWDVARGDLLRSFEAHGAAIFRVTSAPDGQRLATAGWDGSAKIWDADSGEHLLTLSGHEGRVNQATFNPEGTRLATTGFDGTVRVWNATTGDLLFTIPGQGDTVWDVDFSPDGTRLATAAYDGTTRVWDAVTGDMLLAFFGNVVGPDLAFSPDGAHLATAGADGMVRVYVLRTEELLELARSRVTRSLTPDECRQFLHLEECPSE